MVGEGALQREHARSGTLAQLFEHLQGPFVRPEILSAHEPFGLQDGNESRPFAGPETQGGLRADEQAAGSPGKSVEGRLCRFFARVGVDPERGNAGKSGLQGVFDGPGVGVPAAAGQDDGRLPASGQLLADPGKK